MLQSSYQKTAKFYDAISSLVKGSSVTDAELALINRLISPPAKILDIGCGTGRHLIPLLNQGFDITGIENSSAMISILQSKLTVPLSLKLFTGDFLQEFNTADHFDMIISFWNSFNEIALTRDQAEAFFQKSAKLLNQNGVIIINVDDPNTFDYQNLKYSYKQELFGNEFRLLSEVSEFDRSQNVTRTTEKLEEWDKNGLVDSVEGVLVQRWWFEEELVDIGQNCGFVCERIRIKVNDELYLLFRRS